MYRDFPGGPVVKNPGRGHGLHPWSRQIPRAEERLSPCATGTEPAHSRAHAPQQEKAPQGEVQAPQPERGPCSLQLEEPRAATKTQHGQKQANILNFKKCTIQWPLVHWQPYSSITSVRFETSSSPHWESIKLSSHYPLPQLLAMADLLFYDFASSGYLI